jgi:tRNA pseudouridine13 synthase
MAARGRARLAGPLVGYETPRGTGRPGEILDRLLEEEHVSRDGFRLPSAPDVASGGSWRPVLVPMPPVGVVRTDPSATVGSPPEPTDGVWLTFALPKGSYATVLLREYIKAGAVPGTS